MPEPATNSPTPASGDSLFREPTSFANILYNARSLRSFLRSQSDVHEEQRRLSPEVVSQLRAAGVYRMCVSKRRGGPELTSMEQVEVIEELARGDASTAWVTMIGCDSGLFAGFMDDAAAEELFPSFDMSQAAWVRAAGQAHEIDGGYRLSGYWMFGSGCSHADVIGAGAVVFRDGKPVLNDDGSPYWKMFVAPASYWEVKTDTWHTTGLRGTGSHDYTTRGPHIIVPAEHSFTLFDPKEQSALWARPDALLRKMVGIPLGLARQTIEDVKERLGSKVGLSGVPYRDLPRIRVAIAEAEMKLGRARAYAMSALEQQWSQIEDTGDVDAETRATVWLSRINVFQMVVEVTQLLYNTVGGPAIYSRKSRLDRALRDAMTMRQHLVGQDKAFDNVGALLLGSDGPSESPLPLL